MSKEKEGQVIQYVDGFAWGVAPTGETVCLGTETVVKDAVAHPKKLSFSPIIDQIIPLERFLLEQENRRLAEMTKKPMAARHRRRTTIRI